MNNIGIDIGGTKMIVSTELNGEVVSKRYSTGITIEFREILDNYNSFIDEFSLTPSALAVAVPGLVDKDKITACDVVPGLEGKKTSDFSRSYPVIFINDVNAALYEERANHPDIKNLIVIMIGTGIGMSMIVDGRELKGSTGFTGELGYTIVNSETGPTYLDNISAGAGILKKFGGSAEDLKDALKEGDSRALEIIHRAGEFMGMGLGSTISLLNPQLILIGGGTAGYKGYFESMIESCKKYTLPVLYNPVKIERTTNPGMTVVNGCLKIAKALPHK